MKDTLLIVANVWPEPTSSAAGWRMRLLLETFLHQSYQIHFWCTSSPSDFALKLDELGVQIKQVEINDSCFDEQVKALQPSAVIFDRFMCEEQFGWRVHDQCPDAVRILNTEDLHCLRHSRGEAYKKGIDWNELLLGQSDHAKREIASIFRSDLSLIISSFEVELLQGLFRVPSSHLYHLPFIGNKQEYKSFDERQHFVSIGNFMHEPNWQACLILKQHVWPLVRKALPTAELHLYGAYPTDKVFQLHNPKDGFLVKGRADNAKEVIGNAKVLLAPLPFGAGQKGKLLEAMEMGTPSVTTIVGAEAMGKPDEWNGMVSNDWSAFAKAAVRLYSDEGLWNLAQGKGIKLLENNFATQDTLDQLPRFVEKLGEGLADHRSANFIGEMLHFHQMRSTKYMSKWIEAKNGLKG